jgi:tetratricopeptide (TPR) repeat protein
MTSTGPHPQASAQSEDALFQAAIQHHQSGRFPQAENIYRQILQHNPAHADALHLLGTLYHQTGHREMALEYIGRAIAADPGNPFFHDSIGSVYQTLDNPAEAVTHHQTALAIDPDFAGAHFNLGHALHRLGQPDKAAESYRKALALRPDYVDACIGRGNALRDLGRLDEAAACYRESLALNPNYAEAHFNLGMVLQEQDKPDEASACYQKALALKPGLALAQERLARTRQAQDLRAKARERFQHGGNAFGTPSLTPIREADGPVALNHAICAALPQFAPLGGGRISELADLTLLSANRTLPLIAQLADTLGIDRIAELKDATTLCDDPHKQASAKKLKGLFDAYGSDKASQHAYHYLYGSLFDHTGRVTSVLEIGLGTSNIYLPSNMGENGRPGASLRAFRDYFANANIYGADIDRQILFEENRIKTFYVDQTDRQSLEALGNATDSAFDLIIDDGLHAPDANLAVLNFGIGKLKPGGWLVIEDIKSDSIPVWQIVAALLPANYRPALVMDRLGSIAFIVKNASTPGA